MYKITLNYEGPLFPGSYKEYLEDRLLTSGGVEGLISRNKNLLYELTNLKLCLENQRKEILELRVRLLV